MKATLTSSTPKHRRMAASLCLAAIVVFGTVCPGNAGPIPVLCDGKPVGAIDVAPDGTGIKGGFKSSVGGPPPTLAAAAAACGEDHFNWYQLVITDNGRAKDAAGNPLVGPYVDPPPGGYKGGDWQDKLPWYWNETKGPGEKSTEISRESVGDTLNFADYPMTRAGDGITFKTWLVSLNKDGSFHDWHEGFSWTYTEGKGVKDVGPLKNSPTKAEYDDLIKNFAKSIPNGPGGVPEPSTLSLMVAGGLWLCGQRKRS